MNKWRLAGTSGGIILFLVMLFSPPPANLQPAGWFTAAVGVLMALLWVSETVPIPVTSLLPLILFPFLGIGSIKESAVPYANPLIFMFMGGFIIALAMQRWNLHRRLALSIIHLIGMQPRRIIAGFMLSTALISMWVSNTATALMMQPIGLSVVELSLAYDTDKAEAKRFSTALLLSIAFSASIGGLGTLIGTPPNTLLTGFMHETYDYTISFARWFGIGLPIVILGLPLCYAVMVFWLFPVKQLEINGGDHFITDELSKMGPLSRQEKWVAIIFGGTALLWIFQPLLAKIIHGLSDTGIALIGALCTFLVPVDWAKGQFLMDWKSAEKLPWDILLLFGGGLSLAWAISNSGLSAWLGLQVSALSALPIFLLIMLITAAVVLLTGFTSNTAVAAAFLPISASVAISMGQNPLLFAVPAAVASSCAFMLPVATPPNAIVYSSGHIPIGQMVRAGSVLNVVSIILVTLLSYLLVPAVFDVQMGVIPDWALGK